MLRPPDPGNANAPAIARGSSDAALGGGLHRYINTTFDYSGDPIAALRADMASNGIHTDDDIIGDGVLHRVNVDGDRRGQRNGWYVLHLAPIPAAAFGNWRTGASHTWCSRRSHLSGVDRHRLRAEVEQAKAARKTEAERLRKAAADRSVMILAKATPADPAHPYLVAKRIQPNGLRQLGDNLLVPLRTVGGEVVNLQRIQADGTKRFLVGGQCRGAYACIGGPVSRTLLICEGWATGASLHECTFYPVACALSAGNFEPVAVALRAKYPQVRIVICGDDDAETAKRIGRNPGRIAAEIAARACGGAVALPGSAP